MIGKNLVFGNYSGYITETEAYRGSDDEASHAWMDKLVGFWVTKKRMINNFNTGDKFMDYTKISKDTIDHLYAGYKSLHDSPLAPELKALIELRVSQNQWLRLLL